LETDVAILGAGPAGCAAAISAAEAGLRVLLVERLDFPRHRPGETLPPGAEPLFRQLGVLEDVERAAFLRHPGQRVAWAGEAKLSLFGGTPDEPWLGFQAWRPTLDSILLRRAVALGVQVWQPCAAAAPVMHDGRVCGVLTDRGEIRARFVIDGTGGGGWLSRKLGWAAERRTPRLLASYGYIETGQAAQWLLPELQADAEGWTWLAQVQPRVVAWTRLSFKGRRRGAPARLAQIPQARRVAVGGASADVTWRFAPEAAGPGWFLAGDAAFVLDPASSHGVLRALMSGMMAAHAAAQIAHGQIAESAAANAYTAWLREWFERDAAALASFYEQLPIPPPWVGDGRLAPSG
jgi:flavin-dependent dehydrogenase